MTASPSSPTRSSETPSYRCADVGRRAPPRDDRPPPARLITRARVAALHPTAGPPYQILLDHRKRPRRGPGGSAGDGHSGRAAPGLGPAVAHFWRSVNLGLVREKVREGLDHPGRMIVACDQQPASPCRRSSPSVCQQVMEVRRRHPAGSGLASSASSLPGLADRPRTCGHQADGISVADGDSSTVALHAISAVRGSSFRCRSASPHRSGLLAARVPWPGRAVARSCARRPGRDLTVCRRRCRCRGRGGGARPGGPGPGPRGCRAGRSWRRRPG